MTLTLNLPDDLMKQLEEVTKKSHVSPDELTATLLRDFLKNVAALQKEESKESEVLSIARDIIEEDRELLERLAQ